MCEAFKKQAFLNSQLPHGVHTGLSLPGSSVSAYSWRRLGVKRRSCANLVFFHSSILIDDTFGVIETTIINC